MVDKDVAARLKMARKRFSRESVRKLTEDMGWSYDTYISHEGARRGIGRSQITKYAKAFGVAPAWLLTGIGADPDAVGDRREILPSSKGLPILGYVQGGAFVEAVQSPEGDQKLAPVAIDDRYAGYDQFLLKVRGSSMNIDFPEGCLAHCVHIEYHPDEVMPNSGSNVIVERRRSGLTEVTIKEVVLSEEGIYELWPRSHDPAWNKPLILDGDATVDEIQITALVVGCYRQM